MKAMSNPVGLGKKITHVGYQTQLCHQQLSYKFHIAVKLDNDEEERVTMKAGLCWFL